MNCDESAACDEFCCVFIAFQLTFLPTRKIKSNWRPSVRCFFDFRQHAAAPLPRLLASSEVIAALEQCLDEELKGSVAKRKGHPFQFAKNITCRNINRSAVKLSFYCDDTNQQFQQLS